MRVAKRGVAFEIAVSCGRHRWCEHADSFSGPIGGVDFESLERRAAVRAILDCRLGLALLSWSEILRRAGVERVEHYSMYRPGARVAGSGQ